MGNDIIIAAGGAVQGHPNGAAAGVRAMLQSIDAAIHNINVDEYSDQHEELKIALEHFNKK